MALAQASMQARLLRAPECLAFVPAQAGCDIANAARAPLVTQAYVAGSANLRLTSLAPTSDLGACATIGRRTYHPELHSKPRILEGRALGKWRAAAVAVAPATDSQRMGPEAHASFSDAAEHGNLVPMFRRIFSDQLTPVLAYKCLVRGDDKEAPSFLLESVEDGIRAGRYSFVGAHPSLEVIAKEELVTILDHAKGARDEKLSEDPLQVPVELSEDWRPATVDGLPDCFCGGWVGYTSYDTVRYVESKKLPFENAPDDDRGLPDIHLGLYHDVVVFDHVTKIIYVIHWVMLDDFESVEAAYSDGQSALARLVQRLQASDGPVLSSGCVQLSLGENTTAETASNITKADFMEAIEAAKEHILAGDIFQIVLSQRFERRTFADPYEIYRALRIVNPSPYMIYLQARGCILVASSPEILCRITDRKVVNRPLAGTRRRGATEMEDQALEDELLADEKERAEHVMLVDLGRNDVGKVSKAGSVKVEALMKIERYSHVMHISSTVTGQLKDDLTSWDALKATLPVGTVSGAPKVRAMELIDELEVARRGPYSGGIGMVSFTGDMDIALALRTMVIPTFAHDTLYNYRGDVPRREWVVHLQAGAGIVADSNPELEYQETVNKSMAMARAIDLAETAFRPEAAGHETPS